MTSDAVRLSVIMDRTAFSTQSGLALPFFKAVVITPVPIGFVRIRASPAIGAPICKYAIRVDESSDRVSEFDLGVANTVTPDYDAACLGHLRHAATHDLFEDVQIAVLGEAHDRESRHRPAPHCVHVAQRIGRGNLTESERVVYEWSKEVDSLDECKIGRDAINACVVGSVEANQQVWIALLWKSRQHRSQRTGCQLARASPGLDLLCQSHGYRITHSAFLPCLVR